MYPNVHCSTIYKSQDTECNLDVHWQMNGKEVAIHIYNGILLSHKKEETWVSWSEMDEPRACYTDWNKSEREKRNIHTRKTVLMNLSAGRE